MLHENYRLDCLTWLKVGGRAKKFACPNSVEELSSIIQNNSEELTIPLGAGSNVLIRDSGVNGLVVKLGRGFSYIKIMEDEAMLNVGAACSCMKLARFAQNNSMKDFFFFVGIPGTIGGALAMNAGCYGSDTASILSKAKLIDDKGNLVVLNCDDIGYVYRGNKLPGNWIFIETCFKYTIGNRDEIIAMMNDINSKREATQPVRSKTAGSLFKNPEGYSAWKLIKEAGCMGLQYNDAQISTLHCNFLINNGNATSEDLEHLIKEVQARVKEHSGVDLQLEVQLIGESNVCTYI